MTFKKTLLLIALVCATVQVFISEYNIDKSGANVLIETADTPSYVAPAVNLLEQGVWKENFEGPSSFVQRAPLYGGLYMICSVISEEPTLTLKIVQYGIMFFGIYFFGLLAVGLLKSGKSSHVATICFGMLPFFHGFVGYIMTEAISPYLIIIFSYLFVELYYYKRYLLFFIIIGAAISIFRVQLIIFPIVYTLILLAKHKRSMISLTIIFIPFLFWQVRVFKVMGEFDLHPIYSYKNQSIFRPPHQSLTQLFKVWEHDGAQFHKVESMLRKDTSSVQLEKALDCIPLAFRSRVQNKLQMYQHVAQAQKEMFVKGKIKALPVEKAFELEVEKWFKTQGNDNIFNRFVATPFSSFTALAFSSQLNHFIFQKTFRGHFIMETFRTLCVLIILSSLVLSVVLIFVPKIDHAFKTIIVCVFVSVFYLVFFQKMNETRYLLPYLPLLFLGPFLTYEKLKKQLKD